MLHNAIGIDFGTDTIKICDSKMNISVCEKNMIAIRDNQQIIAIGDAAYNMYGKTPVNVIASCPMVRGVIAEQKNAQAVLSYLLKKHKHILNGHPTVYIAVPRDISSVEKRAYYNVLNNTIRAGRTLLVDKGLADTIGVGVSPSSPRASMLVNIGAGTTEISVVTGGKVLISKTLQMGGQKLDEDIITMLRRMYHLCIGRRTAVQLKNQLAYMIDGPANTSVICGISAISGLPVSQEVTAAVVSCAITDTIEIITGELKGILDRLPPQYYNDIQEAGLCLAGGTSLIPNLADYMRRELKIPVLMVREPGLTTLRGIQFIMNHQELQEYTYSLKDLTETTL